MPNLVTLTFVLKSGKKIKSKYKKDFSFNCEDLTEKVIHRLYVPNIFGGLKKFVFVQGNNIDYIECDPIIEKEKILV